jgi:hypothetical protein
MLASMAGFMFLWVKLHNPKEHHQNCHCSYNFSNLVTEFALKDSLRHMKAGLFLGTAKQPSHYQNEINRISNVDYPRVGNHFASIFRVEDDNHLLDYKAL